MEQWKEWYKFRYLQSIGYVNGTHFVENNFIKFCPKYLQDYMGIYRKPLFEICTLRIAKSQILRFCRLAKTAVLKHQVETLTVALIPHSIFIFFF